MQTKTQSEFIFVGKSDEGFLENYSYELEEDAEGSGGQIFMSLEILNNDAEAEDIGEAIFASLKQKFYEKMEAAPYDRFEEAIKSVNATLEEFRDGRVTRFVGNLNIIAAAMVGNEVVFTATGDSEAYLIRHRYVSIISEGLTDGNSQGPDSKEVFTNIANGNLEDGDTVLLSSSRLLRYITKGDLGKMFTYSEKNGSVEDALSDVKEALTTEIMGRAALIGVKVEIEEVAVAEGKEGSEDDAGNFDESVKVSAVGAFLQKWGGQYLGTIFRWGKAGKSKLRAKLDVRFGKRDFTKDRLLVALVLVIVLLLGGIVWLRQKGATDQDVLDQEKNLTHAQDLINDAATKGQFDRDAGITLLKQAEDETLKVLGTRTLRSKASKLMDEIQQQRGLLDNVKVIENPQVIADLSSKKKTVSTLGMTFLKDRLYAFDMNSLFQIILDKLQEPTTIADTESVVLGTAFADQNALVFLTRSGKILEDKDGQVQFKDTADRIWKKGVDMKTYNDKLYMLDPDRNQIWRYRRQRDNYDIGEGVNTDGDLRNAVSFAIDSSIYALNKDGSITVLYGGSQQKIPVKSTPFSPLKNPTRIFTDVDLNQLFILEPSQNRVMAYFKDRRANGATPAQLVYTTQYVLKGVGELRDLYVSKDEGKLYVADDQKVYAINLSQ